MSETITYTPSALVEASAAAVIGTTLGIYAAGKALSEVENSSWLTASERESVLRETVDSKLKELKTTHCDLGVHESALGEKALAVHAMGLALQDSGALSLMAKQQNDSRLAQLSETTSSLLRDLEQGPSLANQAKSALASVEAEMRQIAEQAHRTLIEAEGKVLRDSVGTTLQNLGYSVEQRGQALRGTKGTTSIWMQLDERANMDMDISGFSGLSCQKEIQRFEEELRSNGVILNRAKTIVHGKVEGGSVAQSMKEIFSATEVVAEKQTSAKKKRVRKSLSANRNQTLTVGSK